MGVPALAELFDIDVVAVRWSKRLVVLIEDDRRFVIGFVGILESAQPSAGIEADQNR